MKTVRTNDLQLDLGVDSSAVAFDWQNGEMALQRLASSRKVQASLIAVFVVFLGLVSWITPPGDVTLHNVLHHLNILPFMFAGLLFGWRGAAKTLIFASLVLAPVIYSHWTDDQLDAKDEIVELSTFGTAGMIAGFLADRERLQRRRVETTKRELEQVYLELQRNIEGLKKAERLTAAGTLAASLAHEIRNPLASISGAAGILARKQAPASSQEECLTILMLESDRLNKLLTNFLDFARPRAPRLESTDPNALVQSVTALARHVAMLKDVHLFHDVQPHLPEIMVDAEQIKQVLYNLILNAVQASDVGGTVSTAAFVQGQTLCVEVCDDGSGIPEGEKAQILDPFFTTKETGTGLGLSIVVNILEQHGGALSFRNNISPERGATFRIELPLVRPSLPLVSLQESVVRHG